jgi:hypothetical protein
MSSVFELLDAEWVRLGGSRGAGRRLHGVRELAGGAGTIAEVERYVRSAAPEDADRVLLALVGLAVEGDEVAARVLLQLLLPGTRNLARRWWALGDHDERAAAAVGAVYGRIRTYPLARRPGRVAANILMDAARDLRRAVPRVVATPSSDVAAQADRQPDEPPAHAALELAEVLKDAVADGLLEAQDAQLIARSRIAGHRVADIARHHRLGTRALWDRRQRAEARLATAFAS